MPHYNIELRTERRVWETRSVERADLTALRAEVAKFVGELLQQHSEQIWEDQDWRIDATDETGLILFMMRIFATDSPATAQRNR